MNQQATRPTEPGADAADRIRRLRETTFSILVHGETPGPAATERLAVVSHRVDPPHGPLPAMKRRPGKSPAAAPAPPAAPARQGTTFSELSAALAAESTDIQAAGVPQLPLPSALAAARVGGRRPRRGRLPVSQRVRTLCQGLLASVGGTETTAGLALAVVRPPEALAETGLLVELAMALADDADRNVLLLDADLWAFELSRHYRATDEPGLAEALLESNDKRLPAVATATAGVSLLPCGKATTAEWKTVEQQDWQRVIAAGCDRFDCVIVDAGKADAPQAVPAIRACHGAFLLFGLEELPRRAVIDALTHLQSQQADLAGCIVTHAPEPA